MSFPLIYSKEVKEKGRGVFAAVAIEEKVLIEICPVILITSVAEINLVACTSLSDYVFKWMTGEDSIIIVLGYGSLYNHSAASNAIYKMNADEKTMDIIALRTIKQGEEITINYRGIDGDDGKSWFKDRGILYVE